MTHLASACTEYPARAEDTPADVLRVPGAAPRTRALKDQPLGASERLFLAQRDFTATNVTRVVALEGVLPPRVLRKALRALQARHPLLSAHIEGERAPRFVFGSASAPRLQLIARRDDRHWRSVLETALNTPFANRPGPLFAAYYVYSERARRAELIVAADHTISDGVSINNLCSELLALCAGRPPKPPRRALPVLEALVPDVPAWKQAWALSKSLATFAGIAAQRTLLESRRHAQGSAYTYLALSREQTHALVARARAERTTVTGALMSAVLRAVKEVRPSPRLALSVPINLRPRLQGHDLVPQDLGNYTSVAYLQSTARGGAWPLARALKAHLDDTVRSDRLLSAVRLVYKAGKLFLHKDSPPFAHAMISNSGVVPLERDYGTFRPVAFYSATSAPMLSADFSFFCNTLDDRLSINLVFSESVVSRAEAERVLAKVGSYLSEL